MKSLRSLFLTMLLLSLLSGCAGHHLSYPLEDPSVSLGWPPPPEPTRITYLREIKGPADIVPPKGRMNKLLQFVTGEKDESIPFASPYAIAKDEQRNILYITDPAAGVVHKYDLARRTVDYLVEAGGAVLLTPAGIVVGEEGDVYVSDSSAAKVYKFDRAGKFLFSLNADFKRPAGIAINKKGEKFIVDVLAHKLYVFDENDRLLGEFPPQMADEGLRFPSHVVVGHSDRVYVTDAMNFTINLYDREGNLLKRIGEIGDAPGSFARPKGVAVDSEGHVYVVDASHNNFQIFDTDGKLLLFVGKEGHAAGEFSLPSGIFIDNENHIYVADTYNNRIQVFQYLKEGMQQ